jgi:RND family efflux transporter MFP subunit
MRRTISKVAAGMRSNAGFLSVALGVALGVALAPAQGWSQEATTVHINPVRSEPLVQTVPVIGRLVACRAGVVAARVVGPVAEIRVEVGDQVAAGDVIAILDQDRAKAERDLQAARIAEAEAARETSEAELQLRRQELERLEGLRASPAFSQGQYSDKLQQMAMASGNVAKAQAARASAEAEFRLAEITLRDTEVRAPFGGVVTQRHTEIGAQVDQGNPVVTLVDHLCLEVEADVPQTRTAGLAPGTLVTFDLEGRPFDAEVRAVIPDENPLTRTRTVRFIPKLGNDRSNLAANQSVVLHLPAGKGRKVLSVEKDAILHRGGLPAVFVATEGQAELRPVRLGEAVGSRFEVLEGLGEGDAVIVRGNERLQPGQAIRVAEGPAG